MIGTLHWSDCVHLSEVAWELAAFVLAPLVRSTSRPASPDQGLINAISLPPEVTDLPIGDDLDMNAVAAAETALGMGKHVPGGKENVLVIPHGSILTNSHNDNAGVEGLMHLFPEGHADPNVFQA